MVFKGCVVSWSRQGVLKEIVTIAATVGMSHVHEAWMFPKSHREMLVTFPVIYEKKLASGRGGKWMLIMKQCQGAETEILMSGSRFFLKLPSNPPFLMTCQFLNLVCTDHGQCNTISVTGIWWCLMWANFANWKPLMAFEDSKLQEQRIANIPYTLVTAY